MSKPIIKNIISLLTNILDNCRSMGRCSEMKPVKRRFGNWHALFLNIECYSQSVTSSPLQDMGEQGEGRLGGAGGTSSSSAIHRRASLAKIYAVNRSRSAAPASTPSSGSRQQQQQAGGGPASKPGHRGSLDSEGTTSNGSNGSESDSSSSTEEIHYGPGFVSKLKNR